MNPQPIGVADTLAHTHTHTHTHTYVRCSWNITAYLCI